MTEIPSNSPTRGVSGEVFRKTLIVYGPGIFTNSAPPVKHASAEAPASDRPVSGFASYAPKRMPEFDV